MKCPRCGKDADETYYGPCTRCREDLRGAALSAAASRRADAGTDTGPQEADRALQGQERAIGS